MFESNPLHGADSKNVGDSTQEWLQSEQSEEDWLRAEQPLFTGAIVLDLLPLPALHRKLQGNLWVT
jgi:hypothetical protein